MGLDAWDSYHRVRTGPLTIARVCALLVAVAPSAAYAEDDPAIIPVTRIMMGPALHIGVSPPVQFMTDADAGLYLLAGRHMQFFFDSELGYTFDHVGLNAFNVMGAIGIGTEDLVNVAYQPRALVGTLNREFAAGMRNAIGAHFLADMVDVEVGHQFVSSQGRLTQTVTLTVGVNPAAFVFMTYQSLLPRRRHDAAR